MRENLLRSLRGKSETREGKKLVGDLKYRLIGGGQLPSKCFILKKTPRFLKKKGTKDWGTGERCQAGGVNRESIRKGKEMLGASQALLDFRKKGSLVEEEDMLRTESSSGNGSESSDQVLVLRWVRGIR